MSKLISKYNVPGPRYTSYPTVPYWDEAGIELNIWKESVKKSFIESNSKEGISIYIHLPFCESLCTFCGCNKRITKNHQVESPYIEALLEEWKLYLKLFSEKPTISEIHLGGGTPTFFKPENLKWMIDSILETANLSKKPSFSFEGHPNNTSIEHLQTLKDCGFNRVSYGVQDLDLKVQQAINRVQPFKNVKKVTDDSRAVGYESISFDLVYGLPHQTIESIEFTIKKVKELMPERIAFYSYAHVPWIKGNGQRGFSDEDLPKDAEKRALYERGLELLEEAGYHEIGMDHFALEKDEMYQSMKKQELHRNFMGYTASKTQLMVGLGVSSISDSWYAFAQNVKTLEEYYEAIEKQEIPIFRGHLLTEEDLKIRQHILNLMCHFESSWTNQKDIGEIIKDNLPRLQELEEDGLLEINGESIKVTEKGKPFVRNICMAFDLRMLRKKPTTQLFSMTI